MTLSRFFLWPRVFSHAAPGGTLSDDMTRTEFCLFTAQEDLETMQAYAQVAKMVSCILLSFVHFIFKLGPFDTTFFGPSTHDADTT